MDISLIIKIASIGIVVSIANTILEEMGKKNLGNLLTLGTVIIVLGMVLVEINDLFNTVKTMFQLY